MASGLASVTNMRHLHQLFNGGTVVGLTDGQLLARFAATNDGPAFAALVARYGPMVAATCPPSCSTSTTSKTRFRPRSLSWPERPVRSAPATPWEAGCIG